jgi:hypothetical protein
MPDVSEQRQRARVRMSLPVRIRQIYPPRDAVEVAVTLDVSRNGIRFRSNDYYILHSNVWVTMNYSPEDVAPNSEFPATVVRIVKGAGGGYDVALQFHSARADHIEAAMRASGPEVVASTDRRARNRVRVTMAIRVRSANTVEESITVDVSRTGVLFRSSRHYAVGQSVWVVMPYQPEEELHEVPARVARTVIIDVGRLVALHFTGQPTHSGGSD